MELTQEFVNGLFSYLDGVLIWKQKPSKDTCIGDVAGSERKDGYRRVVISKKGYLAHRIIFLMHHGYIPKFIDHIDRNPRNNRIENLRPATHSENHMNRTLQRNNTSGYKGVSWINRDKIYQAKIKANGRHINLGSFSDPAEAYAAYCKAASFYFGDFARV